MKAMQEQTPYNTSPERGWSQMKFPPRQGDASTKTITQGDLLLVVLRWTNADWTVRHSSLSAKLDAKRIQSFAIRSAYSAEREFAGQQHLQNQHLQNENQKVDQNLQNEQNSQQKKMDSGNNEFAANTSSNEASSAKQNKLVAAAPKPNKSVAAKQHTNYQGVGNKRIDNEGTVALVSSAPQSGSSTVNPIVEPIEEGVTAQGDQNNDEVLTTIQVLRQDQSELGVTENVPSLDMVFFTIPEDELGPVLADEFVPVVKHHPTINPGVEANVLTAFNGGIGWYAGAAADVKIASRLSLTTGLGYRAFNPGAKLFSTSKADVGSGVAGNELVRIDTLFDGFYVPSESGQQCILPGA
jgi:hypothetical protein